MIFKKFMVFVLVCLFTVSSQMLRHTGIKFQGLMGVRQGWLQAEFGEDQSKTLTVGLFFFCIFPPKFPLGGGGGRTLNFMHL